MGRGRKGLLEQSTKKLKPQYPLGRSNAIMFCGLKPNEKIRCLTPNEIKIAEQMAPQQLVDLLLGEGSDK